MKILIIAHNPLFAIEEYRPHGGEMSTKRIAEFLVEKGHEVFVLQNYKHKSKREIRNGVSYITIDSDREDFAREIIPNQGIDLLFTWGKETKMAYRLARRFNIPYTFFVRRFRTLISGHFFHVMRFKVLTEIRNRYLKAICDLPFLTSYNLLSQWSKISSKVSFFKVFDEADVVFSNSNYTAGLVKKFFGVSSVVSYPPVDYNQYQTSVTGDYITTIGTGRRSGHYIIEKLAQRMPEQKFLSVGHYRDSCYPNLKTIRKYVRDAREIYRKTRILLCLRGLPEPFGRVPLEAAASGIPTIAFDIGGLSESVNKGGILLPPNSPLPEVRAAIYRVLDNYKYFKKKARRNIMKFDSEKQLNIVLQSLNRIVDK